jgi:hypothetical protein
MLLAETRYLILGEHFKLKMFEKKVFINYLELGKCNKRAIYDILLCIEEVIVSDLYRSPGIFHHHHQHHCQWLYSSCKHLGRLTPEISLLRHLAGLFERVISP